MIDTNNIMHACMHAYAHSNHCVVYHILRCSVCTRQPEPFIPSPKPYNPDAAFTPGSAARRLADWCESQQHREWVAGVGGGVLLDWLLEKACDDPGAEQHEAERALMHLLSSGADSW